MLFLQYGIMALVTLGGTAVVLTRNPVHQLLGIVFYGVLLAVMFFLWQAPDVALSQIAVGTLALPVMLLFALSRMRRRAQ